MPKWILQPHSESEVCFASYYDVTDQVPAEFHGANGTTFRWPATGRIISDFGVRALSRHHAEHPYSVDVMGQPFTVTYQPAESDSGLFGGNSNSS